MRESIKKQFSELKEIGDVRGTLQLLLSGVEGARSAVEGEEDGVAIGKFLALSRVMDDLKEIINL